MRQGFTHGTRYGYKGRPRCRCRECAAWQNRWMAAYRQRRAAAGRPLPVGWGPYNARRDPLS